MSAQMPSVNGNEDLHYLSTYGIWQSRNDLASTPLCSTAAKKMRPMWKATSLFPTPLPFSLQQFYVSFCIEPTSERGSNICPDPPSLHIPLSFPDPVSNALSTTSPHCPSSDINQTDGRTVCKKEAMWQRRQGHWTRQPQWQKKNPEKRFTLTNTNESSSK